MLPPSYPSSEANHGFAFRPFGICLVGILVSIIFLSACRTSGSSSTSSGVTSTSDPGDGLVSTTLPTGSEIPFASSTPTATLAPSLERPQYILYAVFNYDAHYLTVEQTVQYSNQTGETLSSILLAVEPNYWPGSFILDALTINGQPSAAHALNDQRLAITLLDPLTPGATISLGFEFQLVLPPIDLNRDPNLVRPQIFGYTENQSNLVHWYPFVVPYIPGQGWLLHEPWAYGEHLVYDVADFEVNLRFTDPGNVPVVAASGPSEHNGEWMRYRLEKGRTFGFSASREYLVGTQTVGAVTVNSYYYPMFEAAGKAVLQASAESVQIYQERFGPYPHSVLSAIQADFADGMEYSGLYFLSRNFYNLYDGTPKGYLTIIAVHETAHQWWFELVGSDQSTEPWLDEALCTYSEHIYYEQVHPDLVSWWWGYRIDYYQPTGWVDVQVADSGGYEAYRQAVYLRGAKFFDALRRHLGDEVFFAFLKDYASQYGFRRARTDDFFALLSQHSGVNYSDVVQLFFRNPH